MRPVVCAGSLGALALAASLALTRRVPAFIWRALSALTWRAPALTRRAPA